MRLLLILAALLSGCASYNAALYGTGPASTDWNQCDKDMLGYAMIPDFGITRAKNFRKCMTDAGWEQIPGQVDGATWGPTAYRRRQP